MSPALHLSADQQIHHKAFIMIRTLLSDQMIGNLRSFAVPLDNFLQYSLAIIKELLILNII